MRILSSKFSQGDREPLYEATKAMARLQRDWHQSQGLRKDEDIKHGFNALQILSSRTNYGDDELDAQILHLSVDVFRAKRQAEEAQDRDRLRFLLPIYEFYQKHIRPHLVLSELLREGTAKITLYLQEQNPNLKHHDLLNFDNAFHTAMTGFITGRSTAISEIGLLHDWLNDVIRSETEQLRYRTSIQEFPAESIPESIREIQKRYSLSDKQIENMNQSLWDFDQVMEDLLREDSFGSIVAAQFIKDLARLQAWASQRASIDEGWGDDYPSVNGLRDLRSNDKSDYSGLVPFLRVAGNLIFFSHQISRLEAKVRKQEVQDLLWFNPKKWFVYLASYIATSAYCPDELSLKNMFSFAHQQVCNLIARRKAGEQALLDYIVHDASFTEFLSRDPLILMKLTTNIQEDDELKPIDNIKCQLLVIVKNQDHCALYDLIYTISNLTYDNFKSNDKDNIRALSELAYVFAEVLEV